MCVAERTKNFSGAELEGLVKSAASFALNRQVDVNDLAKPVDESNIKVYILYDLSYVRTLQSLRSYTTCSQAIWCCHSCLASARDSIRHNIKLNYTGCALLVRSSLWCVHAALCRTFSFVSSGTHLTAVWLSACLLACLLAYFRVEMAH